MAQRRTGSLHSGNDPLCDLHLFVGQAESKTERDIPIGTDREKGTEVEKDIDTDRYHQPRTEVRSGDEHIDGDRPEIETEIALQIERHRC